MAAPASENYTLDSMIIGGQSTGNASSANFTTEAGTGEALIFDEPSGDSGTSGGGGGQSISLTETVDTTNLHVTCLNAPLILYEEQSGSCTLEFNDPSNTVTINIPQNSFTDNTEGNFPVTFTVEQSPLGKDIEPIDLPGNFTPDKYVYEIKALTSTGDSLKELDLPYTVTIQGNSSNADSVYYLHPEFDAWIKLHNIVITDDLIAFQTSYITKFLIVRKIAENVDVEVQEKETEEVLLTPTSSNNDPDMILRQVQDDERKVDTQAIQPDDWARISNLSDLFQYLLNNKLWNISLFVWLNIVLLLILFMSLIVIRKRY